MYFFYKTTVAPLGKLWFGFFCSDHEWEIKLLDSVSDVQRPVEGGVGAGECGEAGPDARSQSHNSHVDIVLLN